MRECFANLERNDGFGGDSSPSRDDPCRRALRPIEALKATMRNGCFTSTPDLATSLAHVRFPPKPTI
jgi:hypothetical protein